MSLRNQGGLETLKSAANASSATDSIAGTGQQPGSADGAGLTRAAVTWTAWRQAKGRFRLRNDSTRNGASATLTGFRDITPGGDGAASTQVALPVQLQAGESIPFSIDKSFVSPSVTAIELTWTEGNGEGDEHTHTLYI